MTNQKSYKTKQREVILRALINNAQRHLTADDILSVLKENGETAGKTTVYRHLDKLVGEGLVRKYTLEEGKSACYQYAGTSADCAEHFHMRCLECHKLFHVECDYLNSLSEHIYQHHNFKIDSSRTVLYGICEECVSKCG